MQLNFKLINYFGINFKISQVRDNAISKLHAVLFTNEEDAQLFALGINTKCKTYVEPLGKDLMNQVASYGLRKCENSINPYVNCYLVNWPMC